MSRTTILSACMLLFLFSVFACSEEDSVPTDICDTSIDPLITGDWFSCNEQWEYGPYGYRIHADGTLEWIGIDWSAGTVAFIPEDITVLTIHCADAGYMVQRSWNWDTLRYVITGDRMMWLKEADVVDRRFRRVTPGDVIRNAEQYSFTAEINGFPYHAQDINIQHPAFVRVTGKDDMEKLEFYCLRDTSIIMLISDFSGPGNYPFGGVGNNPSRAAVIISVSGRDVMGIATETYTGTVYIEAFDIVEGRCSGTFSFDATSDTQDRVFAVRKGIFDIPIRDRFY
ncbi:MAG: hypothetical protein KFH87_02335 [Bacteroidetes bacterium]|nr:hypothetical protein [Bacteroidota bacterium]